MLACCDCLKQPSKCKCEYVGELIETEPTVKERIVDLLNKQTKKGVEKYGHTLDDCPEMKYDWRLMAMEEMIDCMQYQQKEIIRLERLLNP